MRREYDLKAGRRNPYAARLGADGRKAIIERYLRAENLVRLDADVAASFPSAETVNEALRLVLRLRELTPRPPKKARPVASPRPRKRSR